MESILIIDDEPFIRESVTRVLSEDGYRVLQASNGAEAHELVLSDEVDLALLDLNLGQEDGLLLLKSLRELDQHLLVIIITGYGSVESAVGALKLGAFDYMKKPFKADALRVIVKLALQTQELKREVRTLRRSGYFGPDLPLLGESPPFMELFEQLHEVAKIPTATVLITGESGTGKELVAKGVHSLSERKEHPFVAINCASVPAELMESELFGHEKGAFTGALSRKTGLFEEAHNGTIFLDEIGDMQPGLQAKLLRVLQERTIRRVGGTKDLPVDIRVIAATNRDLRSRIQSGSFREDLYYRLNVIPLHLPPLRERGNDILLLAKYFLSHYGQTFGKSFTGISPNAEKMLLEYNWPGNVRELKNIIERFCIMASSPLLEPQHLPQELHHHPPGLSMELYSASLENGLEPMVAEFEKCLIVKAIQLSEGNVLKAAQTLKIPRGTLRYKMDKYGI